MGSKDPMKPCVAFLSIVAFLFSSSLADAAPAKSTAKKVPGSPLPTYEEVVKAYPDGVSFCETEADIVGGNDQQLSLEGGYISVNGFGQEQKDFDKKDAQNRPGLQRSSPSSMIARGRGRSRAPRNVGLKGEIEHL